MATKAKTRVNEPEQESRDPDGEAVPRSGSGFEFSDDESPTFGQSVRAWLESNRLDETSASAWLYRVDGSGKRWLSRKYKGMIPDPDDVGSEHGQGSYALHIQVGRRSTTALINIGPEYAPKVPGAAPSAGPGYPVNVHLPPAAAFDPAAQMRGSMQMLREMMETLRPLLETKANAASNDISGIMAQSVDTMGEMMRRSMRTTMEMVSEIQRDKLGMIRDGGTANVVPPEESQPSIVEKFMPLVEKFLPLLTGGGATATITADIIKGTAEYQEIIADRNRLATVINALTESFGEAKVRKALERLGVIEPAPAVAPPAPEPANAVS